LRATFSHKQMEVAPRPALVANAPQMYDRILPTSNSTAAEVKCGYETDIYGKRACAFRDKYKMQDTSPRAFKSQYASPCTF